MATTIKFPHPKTLFRGARHPSAVYCRHGPTEVQGSSTNREVNNNHSNHNSTTKTYATDRDKLHAMLQGSHAGTGASLLRGRKRPLDASMDHSESNEPNTNSSTTNNNMNSNRNNTNTYTNSSSSEDRTASLAPSLSSHSGAAHNRSEQGSRRSTRASESSRERPAKVAKVAVDSSAGGRQLLPVIYTSDAAAVNRDACGNCADDASAMSTYGQDVDFSYLARNPAVAYKPVYVMVPMITPFDDEEAGAEAGNEGPSWSTYTQENNNNNASGGLAGGEGENTNSNCDVFDFGTSEEMDPDMGRPSALGSSEIQTAQTKYWATKKTAQKLYKEYSMRESLNYGKYIVTCRNAMWTLLLAYSAKMDLLFPNLDVKRKLDFVPGYINVPLTDYALVMFKNLNRGRLPRCIRDGDERDDFLSQMESYNSQFAARTMYKDIQPASLVSLPLVCFNFNEAIHITNFFVSMKHEINDPVYHNAGFDHGPLLFSRMSQSKKEASYVNSYYEGIERSPTKIAMDQPIKMFDTESAVADWMKSLSNSVYFGDSEERTLKQSIYTLSILKSQRMLNAMARCMTHQMLCCKVRRLFFMLNDIVSEHSSVATKMLL